MRVRVSTVKRYGHTNSHKEYPIKKRGNVRELRKREGDNKKPKKLGARRLEKVIAYMDPHLWHPKYLKRSKRIREEEERTVHKV